ncbi:hypothetical protein FXW07_02770 [Methanosarcina sp. DH1]|uniref:hypothetical protein n=1 Tax=Methanosarcina sp. DH1 TaxID=2605695 RepID=UPI001E60FF2E|nr:hypothetical protein [Methanosarcina sp. DH1]MCC4765582.1 hypothetical protein [Methanosarcina sp. DH1]
MPSVNSDLSNRINENDFLDYKLHEEYEKRIFEFELLNYKLDLFLCTVVVALSIVFVFLSIFSFFWLKENLIPIIATTIIFGYIAVYTTLLIRKKKRKFKFFLVKEH